MLCYNNTEMLEILHTSSTSSAPDYNTLDSNEQYTTVQQTLSTSSPTLAGSVESTASPQEGTYVFVYTYVYVHTT